MNTIRPLAVKTLDHLFITELKTTYDGQCRVGKMLVAVANASTCWTIKKAIHFHMLDTEDHLTKLEKVFETTGVEAARTTGKITLGLIEEGTGVALEFADSPAMNAALVLYLQKMEHNEIASLTVLREWALLLGNSEAAELIDEILESEHSANRTWFELGRSNSNQQALGRSFREEPGAALELFSPSFRVV